MKFKTTLLMLTVAVIMSSMLLLKANADVVFPEPPQNPIHILYVAVPDHVTTYTPFSITIYIFNPNSSDHRYTIYVEFQTSVDQREGYIRNMSLARARLTLIAKFTGNSTIYFHLWQDETYVEHKRETVFVDKGRLEQNIDDLNEDIGNLSSEIDNLQTALDASNAEIHNLKVNSDASTTVIDSLQLQLKTMYYAFIRCFVALTAVIIVSSILLYKRIKSIPFKT